MSNDTLLTTLTKLAKANPKRGDFNRAILKHFGKPIGRGNFRMVFDGGDVVVKIRRCRAPKWAWGWSMKQINDSNLDEHLAFLNLVTHEPLFSHFALKPEYHELPNGHDVVIMQKAKVWVEVDQEKYAKYSPNVFKQTQIIYEVFDDGHGANIGLIGNRAYMIDLNLGDVSKHAHEWADEAEEVLRRAGVSVGAKSVGAAVA